MLKQPTGHPCNTGNYFKKLFYLIVLIGFSSANAGSYEDFFSAVKFDDERRLLALLQRGFDANTVGPTGIPALLQALKDESPKVARVLIEWPKTRIELRNAVDESPLMLTCLAGDLELSRLLIQRNADVNKPGWTPLHYAATNGHVPVIRLLLEENAYIDAASPNGTTPLMMAARYGSREAVKLLLESGADPGLKNSQGLAALDFANHAGNEDSAAMIQTFVRGLPPKGTW